MTIQLVSVIFKTTVAPYNAGDQAGFPLAIAKQYVDRLQARYATPEAEALVTAARVNPTLPVKDRDSAPTVSDDDIVVEEEEYEEEEEVEEDPLSQLRDMRFFQRAAFIFEVTGERPRNAKRANQLIKEHEEALVEALAAASTLEG